MATSKLSRLALPGSVLRLLKEMVEAF